MITTQSKFRGLQRLSTSLLSTFLILSSGWVLLFALAIASVEAHSQTVVAVNGLAQVLGSGFEHPIGVAVDRTGNIFVTDFDHDLVKEIVAAGGYTTVRTIGSGFAGPEGIAVDAAGNVFVADSIHNAIREILAVGGIIPAQNATIRTVGGGFSLPYGVAVNDRGDVFVADRGHNAVKKIIAVNGSIPSSNPTIVTLASDFSQLSGVAIDVAGNVFVADTLENTVREIVAAGGYQVSHPIGSGWNGPTGVAVDRSGNVYVADAGSSTVSEVMATGGYSIVLALGGALDGAEGVAVSPGGDLFVADTGNSVVRRIPIRAGDFGAVNVGQTNVLSRSFLFKSAGKLGSVAAVTEGAAGMDFTDRGSGSCKAGVSYSIGVVCTVNVSFTPQHPGQRMGAVELLDSAGKLLATGTLQGIGVGPQVTFAWQMADGGTASVEREPIHQVSLGSGFSRPSGIAVDVIGNVFVADSMNNAVKEIAGSGSFGNSGSAGSVQALAPAFDRPVSVVLDGAGDIFVAGADRPSGQSLKRVTRASGYTRVTTLLHTTDMVFAGMTMDASGNLFVADTASNTIKEFLAADGYASALTPPTPLTLAGGFNHPSGLALDADGNLFIADTGNDAVKELLAADSYRTVKTLASTFNLPTGVAVDASGNVFVADSGNQAVVEILTAHDPVVIIPIYRELFHPVSVAVDASGDLYVADDNNAVTRLEFSHAPSIAFVATQVGTTSTDSPRSIIVANDGNVPLNFAVPTTGENPSLSSNFNWNSGTGGSGDASVCPILTSGTPSTVALAAGDGCTMEVSFTPWSAGALVGQIVLTDDALNAVGPSAQQLISLSGISTTLSTVSVTSSAQAVMATNAIVLTVVVSEPNGGNTGTPPTGMLPTGTVTIFDGTTIIGAGALVSGRYSLTISTLTLGEHSITARYVGDAYFTASSSSSALVEEVDDFSVSAAVSSGNPQPLGGGIAATYTVTLGSLPSGVPFPMAITLSASGGPSGASYSFSPAVIPSGTGASSSTLTIRWPRSPSSNASNRMGGLQNRLKDGLRDCLLALLVLPLARRWRRTHRRFLILSTLLRRSSALLLALAFAAGAGCGLCGCAATGAGSGIKTPSSYTITITATAGTGTHSTAVDLKVGAAGL